jgi:hypothetical protein
VKPTCPACCAKEMTGFEGVLFGASLSHNFKSSGAFAVIDLLCEEHGDMTFLEARTKAMSDKLADVRAEAEGTN